MVRIEGSCWDRRLPLRSQCPTSTERVKGTSGVAAQSASPPLDPLRSGLGFGPTTQENGHEGGNAGAGARLDLANTIANNGSGQAWTCEEPAMPPGWR